MKRFDKNPQDERLLYVSGMFNKSIYNQFGPDPVLAAAVCTEYWAQNKYNPYYTIAKIKRDLDFNRLILEYANLSLQNQFIFKGHRAELKSLVKELVSEIKEQKLQMKNLQRDWN